MAKSSITIEYKGIGAVLFQKSERAKRINVSIKPNLGVRIAVPKHASFESAKRFFEKHLDWAKERLAIRQEKSSLNNLRIFDNEVKFIACAQDGVSFSAKGLNNMSLFYPEQLGLENENVQSAIKTVLLRVIKKIAKVELTKRTLQLSQEFAIQINEIRVKDIKTRWGSCSIRNNINLSVYLAKLPAELRDYVIIHELTHTRVRNHQKEFWNALEAVLPGARKIDKKLRDYKPEI